MLLASTTASVFADHADPVQCRADFTPLQPQHSICLIFHATIHLLDASAPGVSDFRHFTAAWDAALVSVATPWSAVLSRGPVRHECPFGLLISALSPLASLDTLLQVCACVCVPSRVCACVSACACLLFFVGACDCVLVCLCQCLVCVLVAMHIAQAHFQNKRFFFAFQCIGYCVV